MIGLRSVSLFIGLPFATKLSNVVSKTFLKIRILQRYQRRFAKRISENQNDDSDGAQRDSQRVPASFLFA